MKPILVIGDSITDRYIYGRVTGIANEDPVLRFRPDGRVEEKTGGALFVRDALREYSSADIFFYSISYSTIIRYVDSFYKRNIVIIDPINVGLPIYSNLLPILEEHPSTIIVWDDERVNSVLLENLVSSLYQYWLNEKPTIIVDSINSFWKDSFVSFRKISSDEKSLMEHDCEGPLINEIITSSKEVVLSRKSGSSKTFPVPTIQYPIDTIGAGDIFLAMFTASLHAGSTDEDAIQLAIKYSAKSVMHQGCYIPPLED